ncbi:MAG: hypothetical protein GF418_01080 [Chitinivibrionales bacterium]|nr:hypothetical protein [Chitinivibrionales bacterium]MBD3394195.1 hypothetical protein [Chitinivibrionales bacterium]
MRRIAAILGLGSLCFVLMGSLCNDDNGNGNDDPLEVTNPSGGESWDVGTEYTVRWKVNDDNVSAVGVRFLKEDGIVSEELASGSIDPADSTSMKWTPTADQVGTDCQIKVYDYTDDAVFAVSGEFTVKQ